MLSSSNSQIKNLKEQIQKIQTFINTINYDREQLNNITQELETIKSYLQEDKLKIQIIGCENNSTQACYNLFNNDRQIIKSYDLETVIFPEQPKISYRDILCLVIDSQEKLTNHGKHLLKHLSHSPVIQLIVVIDLLNNEKETIEEIEFYLEETKAKISQYNPTLNFNFFTVSLKSHYPNPDKTKDIKTKNKLSKLCTEINQIAKNNSQKILLNSPLKLIKEEVIKIEEIINNQERNIQNQKNNKQNKVNNLNFSNQNIKKEIDIIYKKSFKEIDTFFKFCREKTSILIDDILDTHSIEGIKNKLEQKIDEIELVRVESKLKYFWSGGKATLTPETKSSSEIHQDIIYFYQDMLNKAFIYEWKNITDVYYCYGLNGLYNNIYQDLNSSFGSLISLPIELQKKNETRTISHFFQVNKISLFTWETSYKRLGIIKFLIKEARTQLMTVTIFVGMVTGINRDVMAPILPFLVVFALLCAIPFYLSTCDRLEQEEIKKIKTDAYNYYHSLGKTYTNKLQNYLTNQLKIEQDNLKEIFDDFKFDLNEYILETENEIKSYDLALNDLNNKKRELSNLKVN